MTAKYQVAQLKPGNECLVHFIKSSCIVSILSAATILVTKYFTLLTGDWCNNVFMCHHKTFSAYRSGGHEGQSTGPPNPIHKIVYETSRKCRSTMENCASMIKHEPRVT